MRSIFFAALAALLPFVTSPAQVHHFSAVLEGAQEVPAVAAAGVGWGVLRLDQSSGQVDILVHADGVAGTAAHLHFAPAGTNGPIVVPLTGGPSDWTGSGILTGSQVTDLIAGGSYLNVHSMANPGGEIRGQVLAEVTRRFTATLDGPTATPPNTSMATGQVIAYLHEPANRLIYEFEVSGMAGTVAHIHLGAPGMAGPAIIPVNGGGQRWCGVTPRLNDTQLADLLAGNYYVNVHSARFPTGQVRGQLLLDPGNLVLPNSFGSGCFDSQGGHSEIGSEGAARLGDPFVVTLQGTQPASSAFLLFGRSRDLFHLSPLPFALGVLGIPRCFLFHDASLTGQTKTVITDNLGCASASLNIPADPTLLGFELFGQWFIIDRGSTAGIPLVTSNALQAILD